MSTKHRRIRTASFLELAACAAALTLVAACTYGTVGNGDEAWTDDGSLVDEGVPDPATDLGTGSAVDEPDPQPGYDPCFEDDDCPVPDESADDSDDMDGTDTDPSTDTGTDTDTGTGTDPSTDDTSSEWVPKYGTGDVLLVLTYTKLRKHPNKQAGTVDVHTNGGAHGGHPAGAVPPGQEVTVLDVPPTNRYYKVRYKGHQGWLHKNKVLLFDSSVHPVKFARRSAVRNAFFMHQLRRARWNKDGPWSSANCAPTSLAMAAKIFGHAAPARTIEQGIHEARSKYDPAPLCETCATSRTDIRLAAQKLGLNVKTLNAAGDTEYRMQRIDKALSNKHVVVLEGWAGAKYRERLTAAYRSSSISWVRSRIYTYGDDPQEYHSILVVSRLANGKYVVADPLSEVGMVTMNRSTLKSFFRRWGGTGNVVW